MRNIVRYVCVALVLLLLCSASLLAADSKQVIGETARIRVEEAGLDFVARIDTGARVTSLHAVDIVIKDASKKERDNIGKQISFVTRNNRGERKIMRARIAGVALVANAQGREYRYEVELTLNWKGKEKRVRVNLRDRSRMTYKLLIGRNWLAHDYLVDVDKKEE